MSRRALLRLRCVAFFLAALIFTIDRWSKWLVETRLGPWDTKVVIPGFFNLVRSENPGIAFGIFQQNSTHQRTLILIAVTIAAVLVLGGMLWQARDKVTATALALITGGALGNLYDRIHAGAATDFLDLYSGSYHWYTFNLADSAICTGAGLLMLSMITTRKTAEA